MPRSSGLPLASWPGRTSEDGMGGLLRPGHSHCGCIQVHFQMMISNPFHYSIPVHSNSETQSTVHALCMLLSMVLWCNTGVASPVLHVALHGAMVQHRSRKPCVTCCSPWCYGATQESQALCYMLLSMVLWCNTGVASPVLHVALHGAMVQHRSRKPCVTCCSPWCYGATQESQALCYMLLSMVLWCNTGVASPVLHVALHGAMVQHRSRKPCVTCCSPWCYGATQESQALCYMLLSMVLWCNTGVASPVLHVALHGAMVQHRSRKPCVTCCSPWCYGATQESQALCYMLLSMVLWCNTGVASPVLHVALHGAMVQHRSRKPCVTCCSPWCYGAT